VRTRDIQRLDALVQGDDDPVFGHPTTVPASGYGVNDRYPTDPAIRQTERVGDIDWAERASSAEGAIVRRHLRRIGNVVPGTRIGRIRWPRRRLIAPFPWHYWWQAHLLDCLVDAHRRDPLPSRSRAIAAMTRSVRLRNAGPLAGAFFELSPRRHHSPPPPASVHPRPSCVQIASTADAPERPASPPARCTASPNQAMSS
jgi:hypothetical protein